MDINAIKSRLNQLQNTTSTANSFWKPPAGKTQIRITPYVENKDNPFVELFFHYSLVPNKTVLSPLSFGRPDPVQQFADKLKSTGDKDEWIQGKRIEPKMRTFAPVIVRGEENEGVKFWGFGKTVYQELLAFLADPDYGDLTDITNGRDITVEFKTAKELGKTYPETYIRVKPNQTPATNNKKVMELIKEQIEVPTLFRKYSYSELEDLLKNWLETGKVSDESNKETTPTNETATNGTSTVSSVKDSFDDLFNS